MKIAVSFIKSKYSEIETIKRINETSADYLHVDIMDGKFVENKTYTFKQIKEYIKDNHKPLDIHLMCENPLDYIKDYVTLNPYNITFHIEAESNPQEAINYIHSHNIKCGLAINPETDISIIKPYLNIVDTILVMTVNPGKGGQSLLPETINKINELFYLKGNFNIEADGGVNNTTISKLQNCDILVSGSYICTSDNYEETISDLK